MQAAGDLWEEQDLGSFISCQRAGTVSPAGKHTLRSLYCSHPTRGPHFQFAGVSGVKRVRAQQKFWVPETKIPTCNYCYYYCFVTASVYSNKSTPAEWTAATDYCWVHVCRTPSTSSQWRAVRFTPRLSVTSYLVQKLIIWGVNWYTSYYPQYSSRIHRESH